MMICNISPSALSVAEHKMLVPLHLFGNILRGRKEVKRLSLALSNLSSFLGTLSFQAIRWTFPRIVCVYLFLGEK